jgi:hypothetical protein
MRRQSTRGSSLIEFTLIGIPLIFVLIGIFEIARSMWIYATLAHALKEANRFAAVHGANCRTLPNTCGVSIRDVAVRIRDNGVGLIPSDLLNVRFGSSTQTQTCSTLAACLGAGSPGDLPWPGNADDVGAKQFSWVEIRAQYQFRTALAFFWPGAGTGSTLGTLTLPASSRERIQF